ncbi:unnamed protein product [Cochlearia groenlandica]
MDFDDEDKPKEVSKIRRFAPGRAVKPKPKPEPIAEKSEPQPPPPQTDASSESVSKSAHDFDGKFAGPKVEPEVYNGGSVKMEIDSKVDKEPEIAEAELMEEEEDHRIPLHEEENNQANLEVEEEEDVVVREIDVFFNPSIDSNAKLYVLQYPLRPSWRPYEMDERCEEVRVNPSTSQVEIDLSMDVCSSNYDSEFGNKLNMTKQTLTTTWKQPPTLDYAVGVLSGDKLHLNPVHAVAQLRPSMQYLSSKKKQAEAPEESVGTSKKQNKGAQAKTDQKPTTEEDWVALKYHGLQSEFCSRYLIGMMAKGNSSINFNMTQYDLFLSTYFTLDNSSAFRGLFSLPLEERLQKLLCQGSPLFRYTVLKHYAPELSDKDFLVVLEKYACLVQGLWIPRNSLLELEGPFQASRNYVLMLFSKSLTIKYSEVEKTGRLRDKIKTMLSVFAKERPLLSDWKFKESTDVSFIKSYPEIVKQQNLLWVKVEGEFKEMMKTKEGKSRPGKKDVEFKSPLVVVKPEIPITVSDKGGSSRNTMPLVPRQKMSEDIQKMIPKFLKKVFQAHKVCSYETICQGLRDLAVSTSNHPKADSGKAQQVALAVDAHQDDFRDIINEVAVNINGSFVSKSSPDHPDCDPLRFIFVLLKHKHIYIDSFMSYVLVKTCRDVVIKLLLAGTKLMKANVLAAGKSELGREITDNEYKKVMTDLCESETNSSGWVLKKAR